MSQYSCPIGEEGRAIAELMNEHHAPLSDWALDNLPETEPHWILDVGCGGGMLVEKLHQRYPDALIDGIDISEDALRVAIERNSSVIEEGKVNLQKGSVSDPPYDKESFDLITAVETYFFWPDLENDIRVLASKLYDDGILMIVSECYPHPDFDERIAEWSSKYGMNVRTNDVIKGYMESAGLSVSIVLDEEKNWVEFIGKRSLS